MTCALILAAGISSKFFKPLYDKPKGLFQFKGELLIERLINQLRDAGIKKIAIVLGYEKEQYFYLEDKYGIEIFVNNNYINKGNIISLMTPPVEWIKDSFICNADDWFEKNPFFDFPRKRSSRMVSPVSEAKRKFVVKKDVSGQLSHLKMGAISGWSMCGIAYFSSEFSDILYRLYKAEKEWPGVASEHWEQFWGRHDDILPLYGIQAPECWFEFDSLADFLSQDSNILMNVSQGILDQICKLLKCSPNEIKDVQPLNRGLTNVSFSFIYRDEKFVYRYPGYSSGSLVNRQAEVIAQNTAIKLGIDSSVLAISEDGWKLSRYVHTSKSFDYSDTQILQKSIEFIHKFHNASAKCNHIINLLEEGDRLLKLAENKKGKLLDNYTNIRKDLEKLWHFTELDGVEKVLCHNDIYAVNWLVNNNDLCLIDWEYAGINDPVNDIATSVVRDDLPDQLTETMLTMFYGHVPQIEERRHAYGIFALCAWYWYCWSLFKDTLGEDGFFMLSSWRGLRKYLPKALRLYE